MRTVSKRAMSWLLTLAMIFAMAPNALAAGKNTGERHKTAASLSNQAAAYYTDNNSWDNLSKLQGTSTGGSYEGTQTPLFKALENLMDKTHTNRSVTYNGSNGLQVYWPTTDSGLGSGSYLWFYEETSGSLSREHVWPKSKGSFHETHAGADLHHLRPADATVNSWRGNMIMGNVHAKGGYQSSSQRNEKGEPVLYRTGAGDSDFVEVNDNIKGDVARIFLYVYTRWNEPNLFENIPSSQLPSPRGSDSGGNTGIRVIDNLATLLDWCEKDPVDEWEMQRNDKIQDVQGNRNVFIDYPEFAWLLFNEIPPANMQTPSGVGGIPDTPDYPVIAESSNTGYGTVELSGTRIIATPATGYYSSGATVTPSGAATVSQNGNVFTLTSMKSSCIVTVQFSAKMTANIGYAVPEGVTVTNGPATCYLGDPIILPTVAGTPKDNANGYSFVGWVDVPVTTTSNSSSLTILNPGQPYTVTKVDTKLYALYSYRVDGGTGGANTFKLVTANQTDWSGDYVMTGPDAAYAHLATGEGIGGTGAAVPLSQTNITKTGDVLSEVSSNYVISISKLANGNYALRLKGDPTARYLAYIGDKKLGSAQTSEGAAAQWQLSFDGRGVVAVTSVGGAGRLQFNSSAYMFRVYSSLTQNDVLLYAASGSTTTYYLTLGDGGEVPPPDPVKLETPVPSKSGGEVSSGDKITFTVPDGAKAVYKTTEAADFVDVPDGGVTVAGAAGVTIKLWVKATKADALDSDVVVLTYTIKIPELSKLEAPVPSKESGSEVTSGTKIIFDVAEGAKAVYKDTEAGDFIDVPSDGVTITGSGGATVKIWVKATKADARDSDEVILTYTIKTPELPKLEVPVPSKESGSEVTSGTKIIFDVAEGAKAVYKDTEAGDFINVPNDGVTISGSGGDTVNLWVKATKTDWLDSDVVMLTYTIKKIDPGPGPNPGTPSGGKAANPVLKAEDVKVDDGSAEIKLPSADAKLDDTANQKVVSANATKSVAITGGGLNIIIPAGTLSAGADVNALLVDPKVSGSVIKVTKPDGTTAILPIATISGGQAAYVANIPGKYEVIDNSKTFPDANNHWALPAIGFVSARELFKGDSAGAFSPDQPMTRGMLATVLARIDGGKTGGGAPFSDVPTSAWYAKEISWAAQNKLVEGDGKNFKPEENLTREQLCVILARYLDYSGLYLSEITTMGSFSDMGAVSPWAKSAVEQAVKAGLIDGKAGGTLDPQGKATRAEIATILQRFVEGVLK
jgi:endonuclease I